MINDLQTELFRIAGGDARSEPQASLVVGHDRMPESREALGVAIDLASRMCAHIHVVHAVDLTDYPINPDAPDWEEKAQITLAEERKAVTQLLRNHVWGWTYLVGRGDPARLLISVANELDSLMIIVGSRGEGLHLVVERLISPAVSHRLIERARRPVLVVSHPRDHHA
jgi:nucleotide-binding universal stress UspA family protein